MKLILFLTFSMHFSMIGFTQNGNEKLLIKSEKTAKQIAIAILKPIYGKRIRKHKPLVATLRDNTVWVVKGKMRKGGPYLEFSAINCEVYVCEFGK